MLNKKFQRNASKFAIFYICIYENPKLLFPFFRSMIANFKTFCWNFSLSTNSEIGRSELTRVPTTPSCLAAPLELTKKASLRLLWLVRGSTTSLFAHLFGNHRPSFKIDNQRLVLTHCFQSSSSTAIHYGQKRF